MLAKPRVLVISHNVFCEDSNMGRTLINYFKFYNTESLAQLYFHSEIPSSTICHNYYRVTDFDMIRTLISSKKSGMVLDEHDIKVRATTQHIDISIKKTIYKFGTKRLPFTYVGRNLLWKLNNWKTKQLKEWLDNYKPEVVFFASGDYTFAYDIALYIAKSRNIPLVLSVYDDYIFNGRFSVSPLYWINRFSFKRKFKKVINYAAQSIYVSDMLKNKYNSYYNTLGETIMTLSTVGESYDKPISDTIVISYLGNLGFDRWKSLIDIGRTLKEIGQKFHIDIYSHETSNKILKHMTEDNGIQFKGAVSYEKVQEIMKSSDILVHVEDFSNKNIKKVKYSISTKIADSLKCGTCLLAYGPINIASIDYLKNNSVASIASTKLELFNALKKLINEKELRNKYVERALILAAEKHDAEKNGNILSNLISLVIETEININQDNSI